MARQKNHRFLILKILATIFCFAFLSIITRAERLPIKTYTVADGLLRDMVARIRQDSRGFLWFCTPEGISRFDGAAFVNFRAEDGLPDRHTNDFLETSRGDYLIATDKGLARLNPKGIARSKENPLFTVFAAEDPKARAVNVLFEDRARAVWVGTRGGLYRFVETDGDFRLEKFPLEDLMVVAIMQDRRGTLWVGGESGAGGILIRIFSDGRFERYLTEGGLPKSQITSLLETADGSVWAGLRPGEKVGLLRFVSEPVPGKSIVERRWTSDDGLPTDWILSLYQSSDGKIWIGTTSGLCLWQGENQDSVCRTYTAGNDLCDEGINSVTEDKDGNLWMGTACGAKKLGRHGFTTYGETDSLDRAIISSIFENAAGELFVATKRRQIAVSRFDEKGFTTVKPRIPAQINYLGWGWKQLLRQDSTGVWWIPTGEGLFRSPPATGFENLDRAPLEKQKTGAASKEVFRLFEDSRGDVWIATIGGGVRPELRRQLRAGGEWEDLTQKAGFSPNTIGTVFAEDKSGNLWIATGSDGGDSRLIRYRDGSFHTFTEADGSPVGWTRDLFVDERGRLWLANTAMGLLRLDETNAEKLDFARYAVAEGISSSAVYCVTGDAMGRIYVGTGRGLDRLTPETGQIENFTTADGLPNSFIEVATRDRKNNLWFATHGGLVRFQPAPESARKPPRILITNLQTGGREQSVSILGETEISDINLTSSENQVRVEFVGLGATLGEKLRYEYRLTGADWTPTSERTVNFANLSAGSYRFEVRAQSADRIYSAPAVFSFVIASPLWQRWWFLLLASIVLAGLIYLFYRNRLQRLLEMERIRTRIATDLHDDIGANLTRIAILSEVAHQRFGHLSNGSDELLPSIAEISRESVSAMGDIVWAINPKKDSLEDLVRRMQKHAREVLEQRDIHLEFNAPVAVSDLKLDAEMRRNIYLIFKEALNNIARHSGASRVAIDLEIAGSVFTLSIADNGKGFDTEREFDGNGLLSMGKRASDFGGRLEIDSSREVGTQVVLRFSI
jgi:ligand-binding sensor domain-containing protein